MIKTGPILTVPKTLPLFLTLTNVHKKPASTVIVGIMGTVVDVYLLVVL